MLFPKNRLRHRAVDLYLFKKSMEPEPPNRRISQRDIAKLMGISHVAVSMALRNSNQVSEKLREEVKRRAAELGYFPDPMLSGLSHYRRSKLSKPVQAVIGWVNAWSDPEKLRSFKEFDCYWKGAAAAAEKFGYRLEEFRLGGEFTPQRLHQILSTRGIHGLLLPPQNEHPDWDGFPWPEYSVVRFGRSLQTPCTHLVASDHVANTMLAFEEIRKRGYRRIGFFADETQMRQSGVWFEGGYLLAQRLVDESERLPVFALNNFPVAERKKALAAWIKKHKTDAIFTNLAEAPSMLAAIGVKVPDDIGLAVTTVTDTNVDTGIDQQPEEIGRVAFLMLNSLINDGDRGIPKIFRQILVAGRWVDGKSLPGRSQT
jgi:DNA-binding LacI/PurR family transcriptional regulator